MKNVGSVWSSALVPGTARSFARRAFERRVARLLGMERDVARELVAAAWRRHDGRMALRAAAFLAATARLSPRVVPPAMRERAIRAFVRRLLTWETDDQRLPRAYASHVRGRSSRPGPGLLPP